MRQRETYIGSVDPLNESNVTKAAIQIKLNSLEVITMAARLLFLKKQRCDGLLKCTLKQKRNEPRRAKRALKEQPC